MKKTLLAVITVLIIVTTCFSVVACSSGTKYVAKAITGAEDEQYGLCVGKSASKKAEIIAAMNEVINSVDMDKIVEYYTAVAGDKTPSV